MATTRTIFNWRVPESTDFLKQFWQYMQNLADDVAATVTAMGSMPYAMMYQTQATVQTGLASGWQNMNLPAENMDSHSGHDLITNNGRWTCPAGQGGLYRVSGMVTFAPFGSPNQTINARILKNGAEFAYSTGQNVVIPTTGQATSALTGEKLVNLQPGEYVSLQGFCSGTNWATAWYSDNATHMLVERIR